MCSLFSSWLQIQLQVFHDLKSFDLFFNKSYCNCHIKKQIIYYIILNVYYIKCLFRSCTYYVLLRCDKCIQYIHSYEWRWSGPRPASSFGCWTACRPRSVPSAWFLLQRRVAARGCYISNWSSKIHLVSII